MEGDCTMFDILVLGELNADLILQGDVEPAWEQAEKLIDDAAITLGGSSAIFACGAARLGLKVAFAGVIGDDMLGSFCRAALAKSGVDISPLVVDVTRRTGLTVILQKPDDRAMFTYLGTIAALTPGHIAPELLSSTRHVHVGAYWLQQGLQGGLADLFTAAQRGGATTSLDTNWDPSGAWAGLESLLAATDILMPNEAEACAIATALTGQAVTVERALEILAARVPTLAIKRGGDGAMAMRGPERVSAPPLSVAFVDAVGAGDSFDAGFVCGALHGWDLARALRLGVACGSLSTRAAGGTAAQPTLQEALDALAASQ
jgi:sugar/nucleoside kinase (ribokinase family)